MRPPAVMLALILCASAAFAAPSPSDAPFVLQREGWSFDRSNLRWYDAAKREEQKKAGTLNQVNGWAEYDFETPADRVADDGSAFNGWRPLPARVRLTKGINTLLIKSHGGTVANWFTCWISDPGDLAVSRSKRAQ